MDISILIYVFLLFTVAICWRCSLRLGLIALTASTVAGLVLQRIQPLGLLWILLAGFSIWSATNPSLSKWLRWTSMSIFLLMSIALSSHVLPGFNNFLAFDRVQFSPDSAPFTMYLNFDKTVVGIFILLFLLKTNEPHCWRKKDTIITIKILAILVACMMPVALVTHYVRVDPKVPSETWLWCLNNLFFVAMAEEALFRGLIQNGLTKLASGIWRWFPLAVSSLLFGLAHYRGGLSYILLATFAGVFYGYTYWKTKRIEAAILVHFGLNLIHFIFLSYPSLITN